MSVIVFTMPDCPSCDSLKKAMKKKGVEYKEYDSEVLITPNECWREEKHYVALGRLHYSKNRLPIVLVRGKAYTSLEATLLLGLPADDIGEKQQAVLKALAKNEEKYGYKYCPCVKVEGVPDAARATIVCPCKAYRETTICKCGLFKEDA